MLIIIGYSDEGDRNTSNFDILNKFQLGLTENGLIYLNQKLLFVK